MTMQQAVILVLQVSILLTVFGFGLETTLLPAVATRLEKPLTIKPEQQIVSAELGDRPAECRTFSCRRAYSFRAPAVLLRFLLAQ